MKTQLLGEVLAMVGLVLLHFNSAAVPSVFTWLLLPDLFILLYDEASLLCVIGNCVCVYIF